MPRTKLGEKYSKQATPPIDPAWGVVLVRKMAMGLTLKQLAEKSGVSYESLRQYWNRPPITWNPRNRDKILNTLGLKAEITITERE